MRKLVLFIFLCLVSFQSRAQFPPLVTDSGLTDYGIEKVLEFGRNYSVPGLNNKSEIRSAYFRNNRIFLDHTYFTGYYSNEAYFPQFQYDSVFNILMAFCIRTNYVTDDGPGPSHHLRIDRDTIYEFRRLDNCFIDIRDFQVYKEYEFDSLKPKPFFNPLTQKHTVYLDAELNENILWKITWEDIVHFDAQRNIYLVGFILDSMIYTYSEDKKLYTEVNEELKNKKKYYVAVPAGKIKLVEKNRTDYTVFDYRFYQLPYSRINNEFFYTSKSNVKPSYLHFLKTTEASVKIDTVVRISTYYGMMGKPTRIYALPIRRIKFVSYLFYYGHHKPIPKILTAPTRIAYRFIIGPTSHDVSYLLSNSIFKIEKAVWKHQAEKFGYSKDPKNFADPFEKIIAREKWKEKK